MEFKTATGRWCYYPAIDEIYDAGCDAGALGGKLLGAGGGGFMRFWREICGFRDSKNACGRVAGLLLGRLDRIIIIFMKTKKK